MSDATLNGDDEMRDEYDLGALGPGVRGKYHEAYQRARNWVFIDGDLIDEFPDADSVNRTLRRVADARRRRREGARGRVSKPAQPTPRTAKG